MRIIASRCREVKLKTSFLATPWQPFAVPQWMPALRVSMIWIRNSIRSEQWGRSSGLASPVFRNFSCRCWRGRSRGPARASAWRLSDGGCMVHPAWFCRACRCWCGDCAMGEHGWQGWRVALLSARVASARSDGCGHRNAGLQVRRGVVARSPACAGARLAVRLRGWRTGAGRARVESTFAATERQNKARTNWRHPCGKDALAAPSGILASLHWARPIIAKKARMAWRSARRASRAANSLPFVLGSVDTNKLKGDT